MNSAGGCALNAIDGDTRSGDHVGSKLLAIAEILAQLAEDGLSSDAAVAPQRALDRLAQVLGCALDLELHGLTLRSGTCPLAKPHQIVVAGATLRGEEEAFQTVPPDLLTALLRGLSAYEKARLRGAAQADAARRAEAKIGRRDSLLRRLFDLSPVGVVLIDAATLTIIEPNAAFMSFGAWQRDTLIGAPMQTVLHKDHQDVIHRLAHELSAGDVFGPLEQSFICPDGTGFPAITRGLTLTTGDGQKIIWLMVEDIRAQMAHLAEIHAVRDEALRARAELQAAVRALPHGFMLFDAEDRIVLVNDQISTVYPQLAALMVPGVRYEDILRSAVAQALFPEAVGREASFIEEILASRRSPVFDDVVNLQDGRVIRVLDHAIPDGGRVGLRIDVTAERTSEMRLAHVIEGSQAGTWECDFLTWDNRVNDRWAEMLGWTCADLAPITLTTWQNLLHPADLDEAIAGVMRVARGETDQFDMIFRLRHRLGHWVWVQSRGTVSLRDAQGVPRRISGVHVDVSDVKAAEQRLETIIESAEVGTWHHDMRAGLCHVNELWTQMLGYTVQDFGPVTDSVWQNLLHPDDWIMLNRNMQDRFLSQTWFFEDELRLRHKEGHWVWILSRGRVTDWDVDGSPIATSGVHLDISARKRLEKALETERDFLATLMDTSGSGILAVDEQARIVFFNAEVLAIFEQPGEALLNQLCDPLALHLSAADGKALGFEDLPCRLALRSGQVVRDIRLRIGMADGRQKVVSVNAAVLPDPVLSARVVCTITDVTAAAQAEDDLRGAIQRAEAANQAKSQFLTNMSHELRTPLHGVLAMAELLDLSETDPKRHEMLVTIQESGAHLLAVVNDLLDLAKVESGKLVLDSAPLSLGDLFARVEAMHGLAARTKGVALQITLGPGAERPRMGDAKRLLQVMHNLVGNAVKFTEAGSVALSVVEDPQHAGRLRFVVADTGIGMHSDQAAVVFDEFMQADGSITRRFGGTGLGLPIVRRLVGLMGGEVTLTSQPGQGTTVTVDLVLPIIQAALPVKPEQPMPLQYQGWRALCAEDNATNRMILRMMLGRLGIEVTEAFDGDEAVDIWQPGRFDLILLDISMPRKDGVTALAEIRSKASGAPVPPALAVTAHAMSQHLREYRSAGFADVVTKPVSLAALSRAIGSVAASVRAVPEA